MKFVLLDRNERLASNAKNLVCLIYDNWNDYWYITMFYMNFIDDNGTVHKIGNIKIGFKGQTKKFRPMRK